MELYRISKKEFVTLDGKGGIYYPGRWHNAGHPIIYAAQSRSLATLESLVHLSNTKFLQSGFVLSTIYIPENIKMLIIQEIDLPKDWSNQEQIGITREIGDNFLKKQKYLVCKVPSAIIGYEYNYLINPLHPEFKHIVLMKSLPYQFDSRLR